MPSNYLVRATHDRFWPSLAMAESGEPFQVQLYPNKLIESFLDLTMKKYDARDAAQMGVIWGRVTMAGSPIEGAKLQIVGESQHQPTYFSGFIPDRQRDMTSPSGEFAFSGLEANEKAVRVTLAEKTYWPVLMPVAAKTVTFADLEIEAPRTVDFRSYEAFGGQPRAARVVPLGTSEELYIPDQGNNQMKIETVKGRTLLESETDADHVVTRTELHSGQVEVNIPFLRNDWMKKMRDKLGLSASAVGTAAVFFVTGDEFDVTIGAGQDAALKNIAYFNSAGHFTDRPTGDGGFVVFDLPRGFATVTIVPEHTKKVITQLVYVDEYATAATAVNVGY
jgi:hypothetical protein